MGQKLNKLKEDEHPSCLCCAFVLAIVVANLLLRSCDWSR